jgi:hypothetical protein
VQRTWPTNRLRASLTILLAASVLAALVEPAWELWVGGAPWEWAFGRPRLTAFAQFVAVGAATQLAFFLFSSFFFLRPRRAT